jgi:hypothetical protein
MERSIVNNPSVHQNGTHEQNGPGQFSSTGSRQIGQPFNPSRHVCGFYPPDTVGKLPGFEQGRRQLTDGQKRLYERLVRFAGLNGACFPSHQRLAAELGKTDRQIRNDLKRLESFRLIAHVRGAGRRSNTYQFLWHAVFEIERKCISGNPSEQYGNPDRPIVPDTSDVERKYEVGNAGNALPPNSEQDCSTGKPAQAEFRSDARRANVSPDRPLADFPDADWATEPIQDALNEATGKPCRPGDRLPLDLLRLGKRHGANPWVVAAWVYDTGLEKRRGGDPIRSHGFFVRVVEYDLPAWMRRNGNMVDRIERDSRRAGLTQPRAAASAQEKLSLCRGTRDEEQPAELAGFQTGPLKNSVLGQDQAGPKPLDRVLRVSPADFEKLAAQFQ